MSRFSLTASLPVTAEGEKRSVPVSVTPSEDFLLFEKFLAGDDIAAIKVFKRYNRPLFVYCMKFLGSEELAQDVTQEVWERTVRLRQKPVEVHSPMGFLLRIARNLCLNHIKSRKQAFNIDSLDESSHPSYTMGRETSELEDLVLASLDKLSIDYREVLILNLYCGYRFDEIATMLGKSPDSIWMRASRARARLRKIVLERMGRSDDNDGSEEFMGNGGKRQ
jgi:RNA polymerase sigma-70 factor (ECF subfamily)